MSHKYPSEQTVSETEWSMSKWMKNKFKIDTKRHHVSDLEKKPFEHPIIQGVFGVSLVRNVQRSGQPLPQCIQYALQYLRLVFILVF